MTVRVYRYDDPSAPVLSSPSAGSLIAVLDACLVNGYPGKPAAGWTKEFSGTNLAAYRQGGGSMCYLRVNDGTGGAQARIVGYESMTDINTGTNPFPSNAQVSGGLYINLNSSTSASTKPWVIIADEKRFYLWIGWAAAMTAASLLSASATYQGITFFGDVSSYKTGDIYCCQIIAPNVGGTTNECFGTLQSANIANVTAGHYIQRDANLNQISVVNTKYADYVGANGQSVMAGATNTPAYPDIVSGGIKLTRVQVSNGASYVAIRGRLPGCWAPLNALPGANGDTFSGRGELSGRTFILLDCGSGSTRARAAIETSDTWD